MKIVPYNEAKEFIKTLHEHIMKLIPMMNWYSPIGWNNLQNNEVMQNNIEKVSWDDFYKKYFDMKDDMYKIKVAYRIENLVYGNIGKGSVSERMGRIKNAYMKMSSSQYKTLIKKFNRANL